MRCTCGSLPCAPLMIAIAASGLYSYLRLGRAEDPSFTIKVANVIATWPGATAQEMRAELAKQTGKQVGVVIADSHGRPHRTGTMGVAIGCAGLPGLEDQRGRSDLFGYVLQHTEIALADMIASAGTLLLGQSNEGRPVVHLRGIPFVQRNGSAQELVRAQEADLFL